MKEIFESFLNGEIIGHILLALIGIVFILILLTVIPKEIREYKRKKENERAYRRRWENADYFDDELPPLA